MAAVYRRHAWVVLVLKRWLHDFEEDPRTQIKLHKLAIRFWVLNYVLATLAFFMLPGFWRSFSVYYLVAISLYANFATDYDALSASQASLHALEARDASAHAQEAPTDEGE